MGVGAAVILSGALESHLLIMPFQINSSKLFLTYPRCNVSKEEGAQALLAKFNVKHYIIAHELHADGTPHLHAYLELNSPLRTRDCRFADLGAFHGKYEGCRSSKNVIKYCTKTSDYVSDLDVQAIILAKVSKKKLIAIELITNKRPLPEIVTENPEFIFGYKKLKEDIACYQEDLIIDERDDLPDNIPNTWNLLLPVDLDIKKCHYWIWSSQPNRGKTTFAVNLLRKFKGIIQQGDFTYWNIKRDTELIILDEFTRGSVKGQTLNSICDGTYGFRAFMQGKIVLNIGKPLVIVLSNSNIEYVYPYMKDLIHARFTEINID